MKKSSKLLLTLSLMGLGFTTLASCSSSFTNPFTGEGIALDGDSDETTSYSITNVTSDYAYLDGLPAKGEAGKSYSFRVSLKPGYHFNDKVTITAGENTVDVTQEGDTYTFVMPSSEIYISVDVGATDFTITNECYFVKGVYLDDAEENPTPIKSAIAGTPLKFEAVADIDFSFTEITINGTAIEEGDDGYYHFNMPVRPIVIKSDKNAISYDVSLTSELTLSTAKIYKDAETKEEITSAIKGDTVYIEFSSEIEYMKYTVSAKTVVDEGETAKDIEVSAVEGSENLFSFTMISDNIEISATEKDMTLYHTASIVGKAWKGKEIYSSSKALGTYAYADLSDEQSFSTDGSMKTPKVDATWDPVDEHHADCEFSKTNWYGSVTTVPFKAAWTDHILALQWVNSSSSASSVKWSDSYFCVADDTYDLHVLSFDYYRLAWIEDTDGNIIETVLVENGNIHLNVTVKKEDGSTALGSDITLTSTFIIYEGEDELMRVSSAAPVFVNAITLDLADYTTCAVKDSDGNEITSGTNGKTITLQPRLTDDAPSSYSVKAPTVKDADGNSISVTAVTNGDYTDYTFTMPISAVTVTTGTKDAERYANYHALGNYVVYNMYSSNSSDKDFSEYTTTTSLSITKDGTFTLRGTTTYEVTDMDNADNGKIILESSAGVAGSAYFSDNVIVCAYTPTNTNYNDVYLGVKVPEGHEISDITNQIHYMSAGTYSSWAATYYCGEDSIGSVFVYGNNGDNEVYTGVSFTFDEGSTRIDGSSSYHVVKDGETLFDVTNGKVTKASSAE